MAVKAFPSAEGYGANSVGGRGGAVLFVTNLNDSGAGSLRAAIDSSGPRTVIFRVGGIIALASNLVINNPFITIAGQTAPGGGILLKNYHLNIGTHNVIVRYIRSSVGTDGINMAVGRDTNAIVVFGGSGEKYNIIIDHCNAYWSTDENLTVYGNSRDTTLQWCIIAEGLRFGGATGGPSTPHSFGSLLSANPYTGTVMKVSIHHCLYAHNAQRNPTAQPVAPLNPYGAPATVLDMRNNVIYNWKSTGGAGALMVAFATNAQYVSYQSQLAGRSAVEVNLVGNHWIQGPSSEVADKQVVMLSNFTKIYAANNLGPINPNPVDGFGVGISWIRNDQLTPVTHISWPNYNTTPFTATVPYTTTGFPAVTTVPVTQVKDLVLDNVGPAQVVRNGVTTSIRDSVDARIVNEVRTLTGEYGGGITYDEFIAGQRLQYPVIVGGAAPIDSDNDGIPDSWELAHGLDPNNAADGAQVAANEYTNLENYLNELAGDITNADTTPPAVPTGLQVI